MVRPKSIQKLSNLCLAVFLLFAVLALFSSQLVKAETLSVTISADPSFGQAPLQDVDLVATVSGTATGNITYKFDCTNDGSWEKIINTSKTSYIASDLCDYRLPGRYSAKILVTRDDLTFQGVTMVNVTKQTSNKITLKVKKTGRNKSNGQRVFQDLVVAQPSEILEFQIRLSSIGSQEAKDVFVKDILPSGLIYKGNLRIDSLSSSGNIFTGLKLGSLPVGQTRVITFEAMVASSQNFKIGKTEIINTALAFNEQSAAADALTIQVEKEGGPTIIPTGSLKIPTLALISTVLLLFVLSYIFFFRYYFLNHLLPIALKSRSERALMKAIEKAKKRELRKQSF